MKKLLGLFFLFTFFLIIGFVSAGSMGAIWTTTNGCGEPSQNVNHYEVGEQVWINGVGFYKEGMYNWTVKGNKGGSSCDPGKIVATDLEPMYDKESFCFPVYTVQGDDCGVYKVRFGMKLDSYRVDVEDYVPNAPEFGTVIGILTALGALGVFFVIRRK